MTGSPGEVFLFDASASTGEGLRYAWTLLDGPEGGELLDADTQAALPVPGAEGEYRLGVEVCDRWGRCDVAETATLVGEFAKQAGAVSFGGASFRSKKPWGKIQVPEAEATSRRSLGLLGAVKLDGSGSSDPDSGPGSGVPISASSASPPMCCPGCSSGTRMTAVPACGS